MLCIQLDRIAKTLPGSDIEPLGDITKASKLGQEIAHSVQALSRELHSPQLDHPGVVASVGSFCRDDSEQHGVEINFTNTDVPAFLPSEVSVCIFRVVQETLRNAIKHSGVKIFNVCLRGAEGVIVLQVSDQGVGFDSRVVGVKGGLGLVSLQERLHLVKGTLTIESNPYQGTMIGGRSEPAGDRNRREILVVQWACVDQPGVDEFHSSVGQMALVRPSTVGQHSTSIPTSVDSLWALILHRCAQSSAQREQTGRDPAACARIAIRIHARRNDTTAPATTTLRVSSGMPDPFNEESSQNGSVMPVIRVKWPVVLAPHVVATISQSAPID